MILLSLANMVFAASAIAIMPDEHCRSTVIPAVVTDSPAASAIWRAVLQL